MKNGYFLTVVNQFQVGTKVWHKVLQKTGLEGFRLHYLWHTWASWHVPRQVHRLTRYRGSEAGRPAEMVGRFGAKHLADYANNMLERSVSGSGTQLVQLEIIKN